MAVDTIILTLMGFTFVQYISSEWVAYLELFGAGALMAMVSETLIPEAFHGTSKYSGTIVALGFALLLFIQTIL